DLAAVADWVVARRPELHHRWLSYHLPHSVDFSNLVQIRRPDEKLPELFVGPEEHLRSRDGFKLTDRRMGFREVLDQVDYCLYCHERDKDSCSKGMRKVDKGSGAVSIEKNPLGIPLDG